MTAAAEAVRATMRAAPCEVAAPALSGETAEPAGGAAAQTAGAGMVVGGGVLGPAVAVGATGAESHPPEVVGATSPLSASAPVATGAELDTEVHADPVDPSPPTSEVAVFVVTMAVPSEAEVTVAVPSEVEVTVAVTVDVDPDVVTVDPDAVTVDVDPVVSSVGVGASSTSADDGSLGSASCDVVGVGMPPGSPDGDTSVPSWGVDRTTVDDVVTVPEDDVTVPEDDVDSVVVVVDVVVDVVDDVVDDVAADPLVPSAAGRTPAGDGLAAAGAGSSARAVASVPTVMQA